MGRWVVRPAPSEAYEHGDVVVVLTNKERIMFKKMFFLLALCLMAVGASADDGRRVFQLSAGEEYPQFVELLKSQNGFDNGGNIKVELLSAFAYGASKQRGFVPASVSDEKGFPIFDRAFRTENGLGNTVTVSAFREKGTTGNGILIPPKEVLAVAFAKMQTPAVQAVSDDSATKALAILNGNLQKMKAEVAKAKLAGKQVSGLEGQINALKDQVVELGKKQSGFASSATLKTETDRIAGEISAIQKAMNDSATGLSALGGKVTGMDGRVSAVETSLIQQYGAYAIGAIGALVVLLLLWNTFIHRRVTSVNRDVSEAKVMASDAKAIATVTQVEGGEIKKRTLGLERAVYGAIFNLESVSPSALAPWKLGKEIILDVELANDVSRQLSITKTSEDEVKIEGILRRVGGNENFVIASIDNVPRTINKAAHDKRLVGLKEEPLVHLVGT